MEAAAADMAAGHRQAPWGAPGGGGDDVSGCDERLLMLLTALQQGALQGLQAQQPLGQVQPGLGREGATGGAEARWCAEVLKSARTALQQQQQQQQARMGRHTHGQTVDRRGGGCRRVQALLVALLQAALGDGGEVGEGRTPGGACCEGVLEKEDTLGMRLRRSHDRILERVQRALDLERLVDLGVVIMGH